MNCDLWHLHGMAETLLAGHNFVSGICKLKSTKLITLCAKLSSAVYCYRSYLFATGGHCVFVALWVCYHDNSKWHASIFTKLGL